MANPSELLYQSLETDLRLLTTEARKADGLAHQISAFLTHSEVPQIKEGCERAVLKLRLLAKEHRGIEAIREAVVGVRGGCDGTLWRRWGAGGAPRGMGLVARGCCAGGAHVDVARLA